MYAWSSLVIVDDTNVANPQFQIVMELSNFIKSKVSLALRVNDRVGLSRLPERRPRFAEGVEEDCNQDDKNPTNNKYGGSQ